MLLVCPHCETAFEVAAAAIGNGRTVRCANCRERWFAEPVPVFAEAAADMTAEQDFPAQDLPATEMPMTETDFPEAMPETQVEVVDSPPLAAEAPAEISIPAEDHMAVPAEVKAERPGRASRKRLSPRKITLPRPVAIGFVAALVAIVSLFAARESIVRLMPDLAGIYAAVGLPVNLRGLEFRNVRTTQELQDGIPVLVIEGEVVNVAKHPVEVPRVRIAVLGPSQQELYSWTTLLQRSILSDGEKVSFKSRLASPPPSGQEVLVRFLTRNDLTGNL